MNTAMAFRSGRPHLGLPAVWDEGKASEILGNGTHPKRTPANFRLDSSESRCPGADEILSRGWTGCKWTPGHGFVVDTLPPPDQCIKGLLVQMRP